MEITVHVGLAGEKCEIKPLTTSLGVSLMYYLFSFLYRGLAAGKIHRSQDCFDPWWRQVRDYLAVLLLCSSCCSLMSSVNVNDASAVFQDGRSVCCSP